MSVNAAVVADTSAKNILPKNESSVWESSFEKNISLVGILMLKPALRNSKTFHDWPLVGFVAPSFGSAYRLNGKFSKLFSPSWELGGNFDFAGLNLKTGLNLNFFHLLELGGVVQWRTAFNYGDNATLQGVYRPEKRDFEKDWFFEEFSYDFQGKAALSLPLMMFLPSSDWTKIILKFSGSLLYIAYTGAEDGEVWRSGMGMKANGVVSDVGATIIYMLPFETLKMIMFSASVGGYLRDSYFDSVYKDYDPDFQTWRLTPMAMLKFNESWSGMLMTSFSRERRYENNRYEAEEEILQKRIGTQWKAMVFIFVLTYKF